jgi:hypothetical protein
MSREQIEFWAVFAGASLLLVWFELRRWYRRWRSRRVHKDFVEAARRHWHGHRRDPWLARIGYFRKRNRP